LTAYETVESQTPDAQAAAAQRVWQRLSHHLFNVLGTVGFHALLDRSLAQTRKQFPWLASVRIDSDGSLNGLGECVRELSAGEATDGLVELLAHFVQVLASLIGAALTLRLVQRVWPELDLSQMASRWEGVES
jgi:hypothetical protein